MADSELGAIAAYQSEQAIIIRATAAMCFVCLIVDACLWYKPGKRVENVAHDF